MPELNIKVGDLVVCALIECRGTIYVVEEIYYNKALSDTRFPYTARVAPVCAAFDSLLNDHRKTITVRLINIVRLDVAQLLLEYAKFGEFIASVVAARADQHVSGTCCDTPHE